jgi:O-antigen/teichoic acid export membrane protein
VGIGVTENHQTKPSGYAALSWRQAFQRLAGQAGVYGLGNALQRLGAFVLLPLYLARLSPDEYGLLALVGILPAVLPPLILLGLPGTITRYYHEWVREGTVAGNLCGVWTIGTGSALTVTLLLDHFGESLFRLFLMQVPFEPHGRLGLWWTFFASLSLCPMMLLRIREQGRAYVLTSQASFFLGVGLTAWAVLAGRGVVGVLWMQMISSACMGVVLSGWYLRQTPFGFSAFDHRKAFRLALPLVPAALLESVASRVDRFFLDKWVPLQDIGVYSLANQLGQGVKFFYDSIKPAWVPFYIRVAGERADARKFLGRAVTLYTAVLGFVAFAVLFFGPSVVSWFAPGGRYDAAMFLLPFMVVAYVLQGLVPIGIMAVLVAERTVWQVVIQGVQFLAVVGACMVLTPRYGAAGAAWSLMIAYGVQAGLYAAIGQRVHPIQLEWRPIAMLLVGMGAVGGLWIGFPGTGIAMMSLWLAGYVLWSMAALYRPTWFKAGAVVQQDRNVPVARD